jgi:hypothetical protein
VEPDLVELKISKSETDVGFDSLLFIISSNIAEDSTFFLFLEGENTEQLVSHGDYRKRATMSK